MELNITGNPGTGNTYSEVNIHIDHVENYNPAATTVNNYYGDTPARTARQANEPASTSVPSALIERQRDEILVYVQRLTRVIAAPYVLRYEQLWRDILAIPEVAADIYIPGKQQGTTFNRNLVAAIIGIMKKEGLFGDITDTRLTELLEGDKDHSVRAALATTPSRVIYNNVRARIEEENK